MKNLMNLLAALSVLALITTTTFAQQNPDGKGLKRNNAQLKWIDLDGDGICDRFANDNQEAKKVMNRKNFRTKSGDGSGEGNQFGDGSGLRPQDGTGFGRKIGGGTGSGDCDGSGSMRRGQRGNK